MRLILALSLITSAAARNTSSLRGVDGALNGQVEGPFALLKCTIAGKQDETACSTAVNADGEPCSFCSEGDAGLCVDPEVAKQMVQENTEISCTNIEEVESSATKELDDSPFDVFKCVFEGKVDESQCVSSVNNDGEACNYCTLSDDGKEAGLCVDPKIAEQMKQINEDVKCSSSELETSTEGPFAKLKCTLKGKTDEAACSVATNADDDPCSYCSASGKDGEEAGLCVDPEVAKQMVEQNKDISCTNIEEVESSLKSLAQGVGEPWDELKCMFEGRTDESKCMDTVNSDGKSCDYCTLSEDGHEAGLCVDPIVAEQMKQVNKDVKCSSSELEVSTEGPFALLKCTIAGKKDETACSTAVNADGEPCSFCSEGDAGLCVDPEVAKQMVEQNTEISCTNIEQVQSFLRSKAQEVNNSISGPVKDCNINGIDHDACLDPSMVNGSDCIWCDAGIGGFCFPKSWEDKANKYLTCESRPEAEEKPQNEETFGLDPDDFNSNCYKVGLHGGTPDDCEKTIDEESGENCVFCNAPNFGGIGLCMPSKFNGKEGHFYTCVNDERMSAN